MGERVCGREKYFKGVASELHLLAAEGCIEYVV